jgi:predicted Ser/Thr protein kinase
VTEPARIGRFVVLRKLGEGGMGVVYVAYDEELDRKLAVKLVLPSLQPERAARNQARLLREGQALARVSDPHVVHVYEVGADHGGVYVAMELIRGRTLGEWLTAPRRWREVLGICLQIGRGLAAAHAAGVVHRDIKPDNALVGEDGRARVVDFSLARPDLEADDDAGPVDPSRTQAGQLVGTPLYMSPEQLRGEPADARADQFSFCVLVHEALYGVRPFHGETVEQLRRSVLSGAVDPPPGRGLLSSLRVSGQRSARSLAASASQRGPAEPAAEASARLEARAGPRPVDAPPAWLRRVLLRGLALDPAARWPDMPALLAALGRDPGRRWRRAGLALAATAGVAGLALAGAAASQRRAHACAVGAAQLAGVWDPARRAAAERAVLASGLPFAATTWESTAAALDAYAAGWAERRDDACAAAELRGTQSPAVQARRYACLDARRRELAALVDVLAQGRADAVQHAVTAAASLPSLAPCDDEVRLLAGVPAPDGALAGPVAAAREELAAAQARLRAGDFQAARTLAEAARTTAAGIDYPPLHAEAELACGRAAAALTRGAEAVGELEAAFHAATRLGHEEVALAAALDLATTTRTMARYELAETWARIAEDGLVRAGRPPLLEGMWLRERAVLADERGAPAEALPRIEAALARFAAAGEPARAEQVQALNILGLVQRNLGREAEALATYERGLSLAREVLGEDHPAAVPLLNNHAGLLAAGGRFDEALAEYRRGLAIRGRIYGEQHPRYAFSLAQIAEALVDQGRYAEALPTLEQALAIRRTALGAGHPQTAESLLGLGRVYYRLGRKDEAIRVTEEARRIFLELHDEHHPKVGSAELNLAVFYRDRGDLARALALDEAGIARLLRDHPRDHPDVRTRRNNRAHGLVALGRHAEAIAEFAALAAEAEARGSAEDAAGALRAVGESELARGDAAAAIAALERAATLRAGLENREYEAEKLDFARGRARWAAGRDRGAARALVEAAAARLRAAGPDAAGELAGLEAWLAAR